LTAEKRDSLLKALIEDDENIGELSKILLDEELVPGRRSLVEDDASLPMRRSSSLLLETLQSSHPYV